MSIAYWLYLLWFVQELRVAPNVRVLGERISARVDGVLLEPKFSSWCVTKDMMYASASTQKSSGAVVRNLV